MEFDSDKETLQRDLGKEEMKELEDWRQLERGEIERER